MICAHVSWLHGERLNSADGCDINKTVVQNRSALHPRERSWLQSPVHDRGRRNAADDSAVACGSGGTSRVGSGAMVVTIVRGGRLLASSNAPASARENWTGRVHRLVHYYYGDDAERVWSEHGGPSLGIRRIVEANCAKLLNAALLDSTQLAFMREIGRAHV